MCPPSQMCTPTPRCAPPQPDVQPRHICPAQPSRVWLSQHDPTRGSEDPEQGHSPGTAGSWNLGIWECWSTGNGNAGALGMLEHWELGMLEHWELGMLEHWECWSTGNGNAGALGMGNAPFPIPAHHHHIPLSMGLTGCEPGAFPSTGISGNWECSCPSCHSQNPKSQHTSPTSHFHGLTGLGPAGISGNGNTKLSCHSQNPKSQHTTTPTSHFHGLTGLGPAGITGNWECSCPSCHSQNPKSQHTTTPTSHFHGLTGSGSLCCWDSPFQNPSTVGKAALSNPKFQQLGHAGSRKTTALTPSIPENSILSMKKSHPKLDQSHSWQSLNHFKIRLFQK
ncbi:uncharacterized protein LOC130257229 [Oenanthe melanoleuca]|uniref:uncharacterized protein LOC130257229 n=1 Tax=Oenanthe melanoleuca TaxID=2939378 RepID=UPI0024C12053|nr:uncharacterized protein LOC130257229 [Oenanthe melanoleuca]